MWYLLLAALCTFLTYFHFKVFALYNIATLPALLTNYVVCVIAGLLFFPIESWESLLHKDWLYWAGLLGALFILHYLLLIYATARVGLAIITIASKVSFTLPVVISLVYIPSVYKTLSWLNYTGVVLSVIAVLFISIQRKSGNESTLFKLSSLRWAWVVFLVGGGIDTLINFINYRYLSEETEVSFPIATFAFALLTGVVATGVKHSFLSGFGQVVLLKSCLGGVSLGVVNFFSFYFILKALRYFQHQGSLVFPLLNILVILLIAGISKWGFREKLSRLNFLGIALALLSLLFIAL
ncbi:hypothetical protein AAG747_20270 [Rapidithrix thailandica]|uniref:EamA domain-containing protein n=1 Tax=Rapidithrix thailandica TaxID=413964 RepID=A0AAW9SHX3_9BACT